MGINMRIEISFVDGKLTVGVEGEVPESFDLSGTVKSVIEAARVTPVSPFVHWPNGDSLTINE